jgi:CRP/FNR family transcriptional regulator
MDHQIKALSPIKISCTNCNLKDLCMPMGLNLTDPERLNKVVTARKRIKRGSTLYRLGDKFNSIYAIRTGYFKTCVTTEDGRDQVTGFQMAGEMLGLDGVMSDEHSCTAVALEDAEVCVMPFDAIEQLSREIPSLQRHVHKILGGEIVRDQHVMLLLGSMRA